MSGERREGGKDVREVVFKEGFVSIPNDMVDDMVDAAEVSSVSVLVGVGKTSDNSSTGCDDCSPAAPGVGLRPSRKALAMSAAFHLEYLIFPSVCELIVSIVISIGHQTTIPLP